MSESNELPKGWGMARVDALVELVNGFAFKPTQWKSEGLPIIRIQNLNNPAAPFNYCPENLPDKIRVRNGDLLFAWSGTPGTSFGAHIWRGEDAWLNQHIFKVNFDREYLNERYLRLAINQNLDSYIRQAHGGAGLAHITKGRFEESRLSIAPLNEQARIVAKIEELFSDLDAGVAALKRAKANLKRYRASVLKAAVEGKLTEEWRAKHPAKEPASAILARILKERRQKWEADQLAKFTAAKKEPPKNWRDKYVEPSPPDTTGLPELPNGWCWATIQQLAFVDVGFAFKSADYTKEGIRLLRGENMEPGSLRWNDVRFWPEDKLAGLEHLLVKEGQIILAMDRPLVSAGLKLARVKACDLPCLLVQRMARLRMFDEAITSFLHCSMQTHAFISCLLGAQTGTQLPHISGSGIEEFVTAFPPLMEQEQIAEDVAETLSQIDAAEMQVEQSLLRASRLRQSILKQAFEGRLVPQDPKDEPASVLLERLRASRAHDVANGMAATSKRTRAKIKESSGEPRTRIRRGPSSQNQQEE